MGMYTHLYLGLELSKNTPREVVQILRFLIGQRDEPSPLPIHPLFFCDRWRVIGQGSSYYFRTQGSKFYFDTIPNQWQLRIDISLKNYDDEIRKFLDWIHPWCDTSGMLGFFRYEEDEFPTLIFCNEPEKPFELIGTTPLEIN